MISVQDVALDTAGAVLGSVRALRVERDRAEAMLLVRACEWADLHPAPDDEVPAFDDDNLPAVSWDAPAELGATLGLSTEAARHRIHESLELRHRQPGVWSRVLAGEVEPWRARRIAQTTLGHPGDVAECVDALVSPIAHKVGAITLDRILDEILMRLYPEQREQDQLDALDQRGVDLLDDISHNGVGQMRIRADLKDLLDFNDTIAAIADALARSGCPDSLDIRRSLAIGIIADPDHAADILADAGSDDSAPARRPRKRAVLVLHLAETALRGIEPVGRCEKGNQPLLEQQIRDWCGRTDTHLTVKPVVDLADHHHVTAYEIPNRISRSVDWRDSTCVFPWCTRAAARCDHDHTVPHADGGSTCECNIAPLCRHHHRLKTHTRWAYTTIEPGTYLWHSPHRHQYLVNHTGTLDVTPPGHADPGTGCLRRGP